MFYLILFKVSFIENPLWKQHLSTVSSISSTMAPYTGNCKMYIEKQNDYLRRKKNKKENRIKYLTKKVKLGTATKKDVEELKNLKKK